MASLINSNIVQTYKNEYSSWQDKKNLQAAKRQEYLRRNPDAIKDYDMQRAKILISAVDMMDKSISRKSDNLSIAFESATSLGLGYAAVGGATLGYFFRKTKPVKAFINKIVQKFPKSKNFITMGITAISGVLGILAAYPIYTFLSKLESNIYRKRRFETMEKELQDPKIFAVLDAEQKKIFKQNLANIEKNENKNTPTKVLKRNIKTVKQVAKEAWYYDKEQAEFRKKYYRDKSLYEKELNDKEIKDAKKDRELLINLIKKTNTTSQSYTEKMKKITDNLVTFSFALGSLFTLGYERLTKVLKIKSSSLPAGMGIFLMVSSTFFANWAQKRAAHVGRFKAKQDLMQNPEQLIYISSKKTGTIDDEEVEITPREKLDGIKFLKEFFKNNREYKKWKKSSNYGGKDISKAMENIELSQEQIQDGKRLQKNMFKILYKVDTNTQNYSSDIEVMSESIKYPITLVMGTIGSIWGMKYLAKLRSVAAPMETLKNSAKYIGIISLFSVPSLVMNSYFAKVQKMGARVSDMMTMEELEDYRYFADYSRFKKSE